MKLRHGIYSVALVASLVLGGCENLSHMASGSSAKATSSQDSSNGGSAASPSFNKFTDIPMPSNSTVDMDRSIIFGASDAWTGRLALNSRGTPAQMYDFYEREMPNFGWSKVTVVRADVSVLVYDRESRVATIKLTGGSFSGSTVDITVSPKG
ncbi:hypothetical protein TMES_15815 [Thalassospira mesophila]|uniref:Lipoprotein n=1 Tax=Thalassospira mesophila TaxID=1293891 RepID=A0A1Y2L0N2_9PROT|nr:hypothetical protein TMES_15815 [Thalassospira mesophila]